MKMSKMFLEPKVIDNFANSYCLPEFLDSLPGGTSSS